MNLGVLRKIAKATADDDAWAALTAAARDDVEAEQLRDILAGRASTAALPAMLAAETIRRASSAAAADAMTAGDDRRLITDTVAQMKIRLGARHGERRSERFAEYNALLNAELEPLEAPKVAHTLAARLAVHARNSPRGDDVLIDTVLAITGGTHGIARLDTDGLLRRVDVSSRVQRELGRHDEGQRVIAAVTARIGELDDRGAAAWLAGRAHFRSADQTAGDDDTQLIAPLRRAVSTFSAFGDTEVVIDGGRTASYNITTTLAAWYLQAGGKICGPDSLAAAFGVDGPLEVGIADTLIRCANHAKRRDCVSAVVNDVTRDGTRPIRLRDLHAASCDATVNTSALAVALPTVHGPANGRRHTEELLEAIADGAIDADEFLDAVNQHRPDISEWIINRLAHGAGQLTYDTIPRSWRDASMRNAGLAPWLDAFSEACDELADAGAGIGAARWEVVAKLIPSFRGTPDELVAVSAELAPVVAAA